MKKLYINASPRWVASYSRTLGDFIDSKIEWNTDFVDLIETKVPYLTNDMIAYNFWFMNYDDLFEEDKENIQIQNRFIDQLLDADIFIISVPMWNFSMPAILKAYFDLIIKSWVTFRVWQNGFEWMVKNIQKAFVVWARWWKYIGTEMESMDSLTPEITRIINFIWVEDVYAYWLEGTAMLSQDDINTETERLKTEIDKAI